MPTTVTKTIKPSGGGDYTTLSAWATARQGDLPTRDTVEIAEVYGGGSIGGVNLSSTNWTTDSTRYPVIRAAAGQGHGGKFDDAKAYAFGTLESSGVGYVQFGPGLSVFGNTGIYIYNVSGDTPCLVDSIITKGQSGYGIRVDWNGAGGAGKHLIRNCVVADTGNDQTGVAGTNGGRADVQNCTVSIRAWGWAALWTNSASSLLVSQDNYLNAPVNTCYRITAGTITKGDHDATSDNEALTPALRNILYATDNFVNVTIGLEDLHLVAGSVLCRAGTPLSSVPRDFEGDVRSPTVPSTGADEYPTPLPVSKKMRIIHRIFERIRW